MEKDISCKWKWQERGGSNTHIRQNRLLNKVCKKKERHSIMIKGSIQEDITLVNIYASNTGAPKYKK